MDVTAWATERLERGGTPDVDRRVVVALYRLLARGRPVAEGQLAAHTGVAPAEVGRVLAAWDGTRRDDDGRVVAFGGLDLEPTPHAMTVGGIRLHTWCAWDTLFVPLVLGVDAAVDSRAPDGSVLTLTVGAGGLRDVARQDAVVSLVQVPDGDVTDVRADFCDRVHVFGDAASGSRWAEDHEDVTAVSLEAGLRLARRHAEALTGDVPAAADRTPRPLLTLALTHDPAAGLEARDDAEGEPVGSGSGVVSGDVVTGTVRWTLSEGVGPDACTMDLLAVVDTTDGAVVVARGQGLSRRTEPGSARWDVAGALRLTSDDPRYDWLGQELAWWDGVSDLSTGTALWRAWLPWP